MMSQQFEVLWAPAAIRDLDSIVDRIERDAPAAAQRTFERIRGRSETLSSMPLRGRLIPELAGFEITNYRELLIPPYRLLYRIGESTIWVVAVLDGRRDLESAILSRLLRL